MLPKKSSDSSISVSQSNNSNSLHNTDFTIQELFYHYGPMNHYENKIIDYGEDNQE